MSQWVGVVCKPSDASDSSPTQSRMAEVETVTDILNVNWISKGRPRLGRAGPVLRGFSYTRTGEYSE